MGAYQIETRELLGRIEGAAKLERAFVVAPKRIARGAQDGLARGLLGFRKEWLGSGTEVKGLNKPRNRWIFAVKTRSRGTIDSTEGRLFPRRFHRSLARFERGGSYAPRQARYHAIAFQWNRTKSGRPRKGYRSPDQFLKLYGDKRKLVPIRARGGRLILLEFRRRGSKWVRYRPAFLLVPRIETPHRLKLRATWSSAPARRSFLRRVNENVGKAVRQVFRSR